MKAKKSGSMREKGTPRQERNERLTTDFGGVMGSSSADFMRLVRRLYGHSARYAAEHDGNVSPYTLAAIPMLFSALRCFVIEYESYGPSNTEALSALKSIGDIDKILDRYGVEGPLRAEVNFLREIRNEILHPAHRPTGTTDNWPDSMRGIKNMGVLQSDGRPDVDYIMIAQMESHRLFGFACGVIRDIVSAIIESDCRKQPFFEPFLNGYSFDFDDPRQASAASVAE